MQRNHSAPVPHGALLTLAALAVTGLAAPGLGAAEGPNHRATEGAADGELTFDLRYRFETVDQDGFARDAEASTVRLRLGWKTAPILGVRVMAEFEAVEALGAEAYDSTANGKTQYPVVADPENTEVNQLYAQIDRPRDTSVRLGRQRIILDNARFVGNVGWRQNEQTFDAASVSSHPTGELELFAAHLNNANRVFGEDHPDPARADTNLDATLLRAGWRFPIGTLAGYGYFLEFDDAPATSHRDLGLRFDGRHDLTRELALVYLAELATQDDHGDGAPAIEADYRHLRLGVEAGRVTAVAGYELLGGDGTWAFQTPLATLHAFNGWADVFGVTPLAGLEDLHARIDARAGPLRLTGVYHDFGSDRGAVDYGSEIDVEAAWVVGEWLTLAVTVADYDAEAFFVDVRKAWFSARIGR